MKFKMQIKEIGGGHTWWEEHDHPQVVSKFSAKAVAKGMVARFNNTLRVGELTRELVGVEFSRGHDK